MAVENVGSAFIDVNLRLNNINAQIASLTSKLNQGISANVGGGIEKGLGGGKGVAIGAAIGAGIGSGISKALTNALSKISASSLKFSQDKAFDAILSGAGDRTFSSKAGQIDTKVPLFQTSFLKMQSAVAQKFSGLLKGIVGQIGKVAGAVTKLIPMFKQLAAVVVAFGVALYAAIKFFSPFANLQEEINRTKILFREATADANKFTSSLVNQFGLSEQEVRKLTNSLQLMTATAFKGDMGQASEATKELAQRAIDLGSIQNISTEEVTTLIASSLQGMTRSARRLGVFMSANETHAKAMKDNNVSSVSGLTEQMKIQARIALFLEKSQYAQGDLARTSNAMANTGRAIKGTWKNIVAETGKIISDTFGIEAGMVVVRELSIDILLTLKQISKIVEPLGDLWMLSASGLDIMNSYIKRGLLWLDKYESKVSKIVNLFNLIPFAGKIRKISGGNKDKDSIQAEIDYFKALSEESKKAGNNAYLTYDAIIKSKLALADLMNVELDDAKSPWDNLNDDLEKTVKLTSQVKNNIKGIDDIWQKQALKWDIDLKQPMTKLEMQNTKMERAKQFGREVIAGERDMKMAVTYLAELVGLAKEGTLFK